MNASARRTANSYFSHDEYAETLHRPSIANSLIISIHNKYGYTFRTFVFVEQLSPHSMGGTIRNRSIPGITFRNDSILPLNYFFTLLTAFSQSFVVTKICHLYLPRAQFFTIQKRIFPIYFTSQSALVAATAITYPSGSLLALVENRVDAVVLGVVLGTSVLNSLVFGPRTSQLTTERSHQGMVI